MARWFKGKEGGKPPPDATIIGMALRLHKTPDEIEQMSVNAYNRLLIYFAAEAEADKIK